MYLRQIQFAERTRFIIRLLTESSPAGVIRYAYNAASQLTQMTAADRPPVGYAYDAAGRLNTITQANETFRYGYDTFSRLTSLQRPNGVTTSATYDEVNRLTRLLHRDSQGGATEDFNCSYNTANEITSISSLASAVLLPGAATAGQADAANRVAHFGTASVSYDTNGQTTAKTDSQGASSYQWDSRGRLTRATLPSNQQVSYTYDALGRHASSTGNDLTTSFLYDGADVVLDRYGAGTTTEYLNGPGVDNKLRQSTSEGARYFVADHLGSTAVLTDSSGGVIERSHYQPFGYSAGSAFTRYGYTDRELDSGTGLMYYRARWYDPKIGRFIRLWP